MTEPHFQIEVQMVYSIYNHTLYIIYIILASWIKNATYISL